MINKEIQELKERIYDISYSGFPLDSFFNDIERNDNPRFNKDLAYKDLKLIVDEIYKLKDKAKKYDERETPKKVKAEIMSDYVECHYVQSYEIYVCPVCGLHLSPTQNYCDRCSQKLDWSDEDV